jgi:hypothetical protein
VQGLHGAAWGRDIVNFVDKHQIPELAGAVPKSRVTIVNVFYDDNYSHFTVKCGERIEGFDP